MKKTSFILFFWMVTSFLACTSKAPEEANTPKTQNAPDTIKQLYPELLQKALKAHGGLEKWQSYNSLKYDLNTTLGDEKSETQLIDLKNRKVLITGSNYTLGMDGTNVWVAPDKHAFGDMPPRFYHNLIFYFFSIPFVLADPGIQYKDLGETSIEGQVFRTLKISFNEGVGDADEDLYIAHFNPETYQLELLLYTVTYFSGKRHENYSALRYTNWQEVNGLIVPQIMEGYKYEADSIGALRYRAEFSNVAFEENTPDQSLFEMPETAEIDSLQILK